MPKIDHATPAPAPHTLGGVVTGARTVAHSAVLAMVTRRKPRIELIAASQTVALALWVGLSSTEWAYVLLSLGVVLVAELLNAGLEAAVDVVPDAYRPLAGIAKHVTAGVALLALLIAVGVEVAVLGPHLIRAAQF